MRHPWYEFFAGGGMARLGLGERNWECVFANDICEKKAASYRAAFGPSRELKVADVAALSTRDLPGSASLAWASFPCQDLSLAGNGAGLKGVRSGTFTPFWDLIAQLRVEGRAPRVVTLENVTGAITSHSGKDFETILDRMIGTEYRVGALVIDAAHFLPQSRPRLFIVGVSREIPIPVRLQSTEPIAQWHPSTLRKAIDRLRPDAQRDYVWWRLPRPTSPIASLSDLLQANPEGVKWHSQDETKRLLGMMSPLNSKKIQAASHTEKRQFGTVYKRIRPDENGQKVQRAEVRFDGVAGCLRTPVGGSSRQIVLEVKGRRIRSRLLAPREAARLMGVHDGYPLPTKYNEAYHLFGDGVAVPVAARLSKHLLRPLASSENSDLGEVRPRRNYFVGRQPPLNLIELSLGK